MIWEENVALPPHNPQCLGCGPDNPAGLHLEVVRVGNDVVTEITFDLRQRGGPGLAHGGALAVACDDLFGFVTYLVGEPAVTRSLQIEYHRPVALDQSYRIAARLDRRDGRKLHMSGEGADSDGALAFSATALFLVVEVAHFERFGTIEADPGLTALFGTRRDVVDQRAD